MFFPSYLHQLLPIKWDYSFKARSTYTGFRTGAEFRHFLLSSSNSVDVFSWRCGNKHVLFTKWIFFSSLLYLQLCRSNLSSTGCIYATLKLLYYHQHHSSSHHKEGHGKQAAINELYEMMWQFLPGSCALHSSPAQAHNLTSAWLAFCGQVNHSHWQFMHFAFLSTRTPISMKKEVDKK